MVHEKGLNILFRCLLRMETHRLKVRRLFRDQVFGQPEVLVGLRQPLSYEFAFDLFRRLHR